MLPRAKVSSDSPQARQPEHRPRLLRGAEVLHLNQDLLRARLSAHALPRVPVRIGMWYR